MEYFRLEKLSASRRSQLQVPSPSKIRGFCKSNQELPNIKTTFLIKTQISTLSVPGQSSLQLTQKCRQLWPQPPPWMQQQSQAIKSLKSDPIKFIWFMTLLFRLNSQHTDFRSRGRSWSSPGAPTDLLWEHVHRHPPPWWIEKNRQWGQELGIWNFDCIVKTSAKD